VYICVYVCDIINIINQFRWKRFGRPVYIMFWVLYFWFGMVFFSLSFYVPGVFRPNIDTARKLTSIVYIITPVLRLAPLNNSRYMWYSYVNGRGKHLDVIGLVSEKKKRKWLWSIYISFQHRFPNRNCTSGGRKSSLEYLIGRNVTFQYHRIHSYYIY
jgi:hypothetical protein